MFEMYLLLPNLSLEPRGLDSHIHFASKHICCFKYLLSTICEPDTAEHLEIQK